MLIQAWHPRATPTRSRRGREAEPRHAPTRASSARRRGHRHRGGGGGVAVRRRRAAARCGEESRSRCKTPEHPPLEPGPNCACCRSRAEPSIRRGVEGRMPTRMNAGEQQVERELHRAYSFVPTPVRLNAHPKMPCGRTSPLEPQMPMSRYTAGRRSRRRGRRRTGRATRTRRTRRSPGGATAAELLAARLDRPRRKHPANRMMAVSSTRTRPMPSIPRL